MNKLAKTFLIALLVGLPAGAEAQDTTPKAEDFPVGTEAQVQVGQTYLKKTSGDWQVRCIKTADGPEPCQLYQLLNNDQKTPVAELSFFHLPGGGAVVLGATVITPLGTMLQSQLKFEIPGAQPKLYPYGWCEAAGCIARLGFTGLELEGLKKGDAASITIASIANPQQPIKLTISLKGFSEGFKEILVKQ